MIWASGMRRIPEKSGSEPAVERELGERAGCWHRLIVQGQIILVEVVSRPNFLVQQDSLHTPETGLEDHFPVGGGGLKTGYG